MPYPIYVSVAFGSSKAGLSTVGYSLYDSTGTAIGSRITSGIQDLAQGQYGAVVTIPDAFRGRITWDTGDDPIRVASSIVNPEDLEDISRIITELEEVLVLPPPPGPQAVLINQDYSGVDSFTYQDPAHVGIVGATVTAYLLADYNAGDRGVTFVKGQTTTGTSGHWTSYLLLAPGEYILVFFKEGLYGPDFKILVVS